MFLGKPSAINQNELIGFTTTVLLFKKKKKNPCNFIINFLLKNL